MVLIKMTLIRIILGIILTIMMWIRVDWTVGMFAIFVLIVFEIQAGMDKEILLKIKRLLKR